MVPMTSDYMPEDQEVRDIYASHDCQLGLYDNAVGEFDRFLAETKMRVWDEAIEKVRGHVTPFIWRKLMADNPYRKEKNDA